jgi:hypothetical protein
MPLGQLFDNDIFDAAIAGKEDPRLSGRDQKSQINKGKQRNKVYE